MLSKIVFLFLLGFLVISPVYGELNPSSLEIYSPEEAPPLSYEEDGKPQGLANDIIRAIQIPLKNKSLIYIVPWTRGYQMLQTKPNVILSSIGYTKERAQMFYMVGPIASIEVAFFAKKNSPLKIRSLEEVLKVRRIAVRRNTVYETLLREKGFKDLILTENILQSERLLASNRVDLFLDSAPEAQGILKKENLNPDSIQKTFVLMNLDLYMAFSKGTSPQTVQEWKKSLQKMKEDGRFQKIYRKWLPEGKIPLSVEETHPPMTEEKF